LKFKLLANLSNKKLVFVFVKEKRRDEKSTFKLRHADFVCILMIMIMIMMMMMMMRQGDGLFISAMMHDSLYV
jgi:ATP-dependent Zn protease